MYSVQRKGGRNKQKLEKVDWFTIAPLIGEGSGDIAAKFGDLVEKDSLMYVERYAEGYSGGNPSRLQDALRDFFRSSRDGRQMVIAIVGHGNSGDGGFEDNLKGDDYDDPREHEPERFFWTPAMLWNGRSEFCQLSPYLGLRSILSEGMKDKKMKVTILCAQCYGAEFASFLHQQRLVYPLDGKLSTNLEIRHFSYGPTFPCILCENELKTGDSPSNRLVDENQIRRPCAVNDDVIDWLKSLAEGSVWEPNNDAGTGGYVSVDKKIKI